MRKETRHSFNVAIRLRSRSQHFCVKVSTYGICSEVHYIRCRKKKSSRRYERLVVAKSQSSERHSHTRRNSSLVQCNRTKLRVSQIGQTVKRIAIVNVYWPDNSKARFFTGLSNEIFYELFHWAFCLYPFGWCVFLFSFWTFSQRAFERKTRAIMEW